MTYDAAQLANARAIVAACIAANLPQAGAVIPVMVAMTECGLRNLASANVPASQQYPHDYWPGSSDGLGHDHASMGLFQQQTGYRWTPAGYAPPEIARMDQTTMDSPDGWGVPSVLMNPRYSTNLFLLQLALTDWQHMSPWMAAQAIQRSASADGSNYQANYSAAVSLVGSLWIELSTDALNTRPLTSEEDDDMILILNGGDGGRSGFWLSGGKAMTSNDATARTAHRAAGGRVEVWPAVEFSRGLKTWSA